MVQLFMLVCVLTNQYCDLILLIIFYLGVNFTERMTITAGCLRQIEQAIQQDN